MSSRLDRVKDWEGLTKLARYTVCGLAKKVKCTDRQLRRHFAKRGTTPRRWMQELRLRKAASGLLQGEDVKNASAEAGYQHPASFSRAFHRLYNKPPSAISASDEPDSG